MSIFKKSVTSFVLMVFLWQSAGQAVAGIVKYSTQEPPKAVQMNPLAAMLNPMGGMPLTSGLGEDQAVNIPLGYNGQIQDPALLRTMLTEVSEMAASAPLELAPEGHPLQTSDMHERMTGGDARVRSNDAGAIITDLGANTQSNKVFDMTESAPMLWARYYPYRRVGYIQMITFRKKAYTAPFDVSTRMANVATRSSAIADAVEIQTEVLGPIDGERLIKGNGVKLPYRGVNPFKPFIKPDDTKMYAQISFAAFLTAVGVWGRYYSTQRGFVAVAENRQEKKEWSECTKRVFGACLRRRSHVESYVELKPRWYLMTSGDNAIGKANIMAYASEECKTKTSLLPPGTAFAAARDSECVVFSGAAFLEASTNADIPQEWLKVWHQHYAREGWTMLFFFIFFMIGGFAFSMMIGPIFAGTMEIAVAAIGAGLDVVMTIAVIDGILVAGAYALTSFILNGGGSLSDIQSGIFGRLGSGVEIPDISAEDRDWSPNDCVVDGPTARRPYLWGSGHRHQRAEVAPNTTQEDMPTVSGCIHWLKNDLNTAPGSTGEYFRARRPEAVRDYTIPNDVENMRSQETRPRRFDGSPVRE